MGMMDGFATKTLVERILLLDGIEKEGRFEASRAPGLLRGSRQDEAVRHALADTLRALLPCRRRRPSRGCAQGPQGPPHVHPSGRQHIRVGSARPSGPGARGGRPGGPAPRALGPAGPAARGDLAVYRKFASQTDAVLASLSLEMLGFTATSTRSHTLQGGRGLGARGRYEMCDSPPRRRSCRLRPSGPGSRLLPGLEAPPQEPDRSAHRHRGAGGRRRLGHPGGRHGVRDGRHRQQDPRREPARNDGAPQGGEALVAALDRKSAETSNVRFAVYEALGNIPS